MKVKNIEVSKKYLCNGQYEVIVEKICETQDKSPSGYIFIKGLKDGITECVHYTDLEEI